MTSLDEARAKDAADPLRHHRDAFALPADTIYLDGNSLGALPKAAVAIMHDAVTRQWGERLIRSWNEADWIDAPQRIGDKIAAIIGADDGEVIVADSTSVNVFKLLTALTAQRPEATHILSESGNFPTDVHIADGAARAAGMDLRLVDRDAIVDAIAEDTAALLLTHVHYKSGERYDIKAGTAAARAKGVPVLWDLSHSAGAVPLDLDDAGADYAVGCGYKYLNGGPGAPAFIYAARAHQADLRPALQGWMGDARPFAFEDAYEPAPGMGRMLIGTAPMLSLLALECGVDAMLAADDAALWAKSQALFDLLTELMADRCPEFTLVTPTDADARGSHASFAHADAWPINRALIDACVIGDFRAPDVLRLGLTPLYTSFQDVWRAVDVLAGIMATETWRDPQYAERATVT